VNEAVGLRQAEEAAAFTAAPNSARWHLRGCHQTRQLWGPLANSLCGHGIIQGQNARVEALVTLPPHLQGPRAGRTGREVSSENVQ
jgi:hypothetical protein